MPLSDLMGYIDDFLIMFMGGATIAAFCIGLHQNGLLVKTALLFAVIMGSVVALAVGIPALAR